MAQHNLSALLFVLFMVITVHEHEHEHLYVVAFTDSNVLVATLDTDGTSFTINLPIGTSAQTLPLLLDVQSPFTALHCTDQDLNSSSSFHPSLSSTFLTPYSSPAPACIADPPSSSPSPFPMSSCSCAQDTINLYVERTQFPDPLLSFNVSAVNFTCCAEVESSNVAVGVAGLGRGDGSLAAQISKSAGLARQFSYCLPDIAFFGRVTTYAVLNPILAQMETLTTSLQTRLYYVKGGGYAFKLYNMSMMGEASGMLRTPLKMRVSTTQTYTTLETSVYKAFRQSFRQAIGYNTAAMKAVPAIKPFDTCFDTTAAYYAGQAPYLKTPTLGFEVEGGRGWTLYPSSTFVYNGSNSMVACMGFLKAGPGQPSVLGTFQQVNCLAEFDLKHSRFGFRSIFDPNNFHPEITGCSSLYYPMYVK